MIEVKQVSKTYRIHQKAEGLRNSWQDFLHRRYQDKTAVRDLSFTIQAGEAVGLLGANGAGKTTTLKLLTGILYPSSGEIRVNGFTPTGRNREFLRQIAFVMGNKSDIHWDLPALDSFRYQQLVYAIPEQQYRKTLDELAELLHVTSLLSTPLRRLSLGERMKMELINNFLYRPQLIFLDEPTIGLDLQSQIDLRQFIRTDNQRTGSSMIITSHYPDDIEATCDRILFLRDGGLVHDGSLSELRGEGSFRDSVLRLLQGEQP